jgi:superfamily II DNA/RNA helicase
MSFFALGLRPNLVRAAARHGFEYPSPIQTAAIPIVLSAKDVLASAQTGSGKTLAYGLPLLQLVSSQIAQNPRLTAALVMVPTRELAIQVGQTLRDIANQMDVGVRLSVVFGGVSINPQLLAMRGGTDFIIATPGRLLDLVSHNAVDLSNIKHYVLDEADRLLEMGFDDELSAIGRLLPQRKQSLFFSATFPASVLSLARSMLHDPVEIAISSEPQNEPEIAQHAVLVDTGRRTQLLRHLINTNHWKRVLVFVATKHAAEIVADKLRKARIYAEPFHGELSQGKRMQVLSDFKASRLKVVIATDMASRGLDIHQLPVVVNYDLPRSSTDYIHRIGRTGRAGETGIAFTFVTPQTQSHYRMIENKNNLSINIETVEGFEPAIEETPAEVAINVGGVKGKRPSKKDKLRAAAKVQ